MIIFPLIVHLASSLDHYFLYSDYHHAVISSRVAFNLDENTSLAAMAASTIPVYRCNRDTMRRYVVQLSRNGISFRCRFDNRAFYTFLLYLDVHRRPKIRHATRHTVSIHTILSQYDFIVTIKSHLIL